MNPTPHQTDPSGNDRVPIVPEGPSSRPIDLAANAPGQPFIVKVGEKIVDPTRFEPISFVFTRTVTAPIESSSPDALAAPISPNFTNAPSNPPNGPYQVPGGFTPMVGEKVTVWVLLTNATWDRHDFPKTPKPGTD